MSKLTNFFTGWRYNPDKAQVLRRLEFLEETATLSEEEQKAHQWNELKRILSLAYHHTRHYRIQFDQAGITPDDIQSFADLKKIPFLVKEQIKADYDSFIVDTVKKEELFTITSGGSTGNPLVVYYDEEFNAKDRANTFYYLAINGHNPFVSRCVRIHGDPIPEEASEKGTYSFTVGENKLILSSQHIGKETAESYARQIRDFKPHYIHAYPSALYALCVGFKEANVTVDFPLDCVYCDSEMLYPDQKRYIEETLHCKVMQTYGHTEGAVIAISVSGSDALHVLPQVGFTEIIKENGDDAKVGETGEIVVTGFNNTVFPLVRYRTGDLATVAPTELPCKNGYLKLTHIQGRVQDFAVDKNNHRVPVAPGLFDYNIDWSGVTRFQMIQNEAGKANLLLEIAKEKENDFPNIATRLNNHLTKVYGNLLTFSIKKTESLPSTSRGKFRYFIQNIP